MALQESTYLTADDDLDVTAAGKSLAHAGGVYIELHYRIAARQHIALKTGRNSKGKSIKSGVHPGIRLGLGDQLRGHEMRRVEGVDNTCGERRLILIYNGYGRLMQRFRRSRSSGINRKCKRSDNEYNHHRVAQQTAQFLDAEVENIGSAHS